MNIEQMKKDWEQHCKEYGFEPVCFKLSGGVWVVLKYSKTDNNICIPVDNINNTEISIESKNINEIKLFTTFYEKLLEPEKDNQRRCNFCYGVLDEDFIVTNQGDMCSKCLDRD